MSSLGAGNSEGHGRFAFRNVVEPVLPGRIMEDRTAQEAVVRDSTVPRWTIVRPTELSDGESAPVRVMTDLKAEPEPGTITRRGVAATLVRLLEDDAHDGHAIVVTNRAGVAPRESRGLTGVLPSTGAGPPRSTTAMHMGISS